MKPPGPTTMRRFQDHTPPFVACPAGNCRRLVGPNGVLCRDHYTGVPRYRRRILSNAQKLGDAAAVKAALDGIVAVFAAPPCDAGEAWRVVSGYEPYEASDRGRVRRGGRILKGFADRDGYRRISTSIGGIRTQVPVHTFVLLAFAGPRPSDKHEAAHGPAGKLVNTPTNLRWATSREQYQDRLRDGTDCVGVKHPRAYLTPELVRELRRLYVPRSKTRGLLALCRQFNIERGAAYTAIIGQNWRSVSGAAR